jgi:hypothetical protein
VFIDLETLSDSDIFDLIITKRLSKHDFAAWTEHQRDIWFNNGTLIHTE